MRIVVIGISGAGKSTMAGALARGLGAPHVELDALFWEPDWQPANPRAFAARVAAATQGERWVVDGNYSAVRALVWGRATHLVWLDYERLPIMARVIRRSVIRAATKRELWNGNRERWGNFLHASHPIRWAWHHWRGRRRALEATFATGEYPNLVVTRLRYPHEAEAVVQALLAAQPSRAFEPPMP